ncbi:MAG TPA: citrate transporter [Blastocatellia bacterium]|nr:citrate transporter [Blastocatellia bacterium]HMX29636.1 citrate transporter [Blastocatellia bacterium]HMY75914.1 citrate transporter [Blastocatellia bacterium]HMZ16948.1 citrate transporter [Blastocatellia bacterium]HNG34442.1 citrate transporter [Blastocatellia bacterium]
MTAFLIILVFVIFAALMISRRMPAILAVPAMAIVIAAIVQTPLSQILNQVVAAGATRLAEAYMMVFAGAMLGRVVMQTGIAEGIIKRAAEFGGDKPMIVAVTLMAAIALLFTALYGLGAIIMVGGLALPIMMSIGVPRKPAGVLFLLAYGLGFIFNIATWGFYQKTLNLDPQAIKGYAATLAAIDAAAIIVFLVIASRRMSSYGAWAVAVEEDKAAKRGAPLIAMLIPLLPLALHIGLKWHVVPSFFAGAILGVLVTRPRELVKQLSSAAVKGLEDVAPAVILMIGIGMLLNATTLPAVQASLRPMIEAVNFRSPLVYVLFFGLLSPLSLYRGPLNPYGIGIGVYSLISVLGLMPPLALLAALMSVVQVQTACDPTNTHNVWIANYVGMRVEELTRQTLLFKVAVCLAGLIVGAWLYLK